MFEFEIDLNFEDTQIIDTGYAFITEEYPFEHLDDLED